MVHITDHILRLHRVVGTALLCLLVFSCEKSDNLENTDTCAYPVVVIASTGEGSGTKVSVTAGNELVWDTSDKLSFLSVSASGKSASSILEILSVSSSDASSAKFGGSVEMEDEPQCCYFAYPHADGVLANDGSKAVATFSYSSQTGKHEPFLYGAATYSVSGISTSLHHVGGMLRIKLPDASTVKKITVTGNNGEPLTPYIYSMEMLGGDSGTGSGSGSGTVSASGAMAQDAAASFDVTLSGSSLEEKEGSYYCYIAMPPVNFTKGFSLVFNNGDSDMYKSYNYAVPGGYDFSQSGSIVDIDASEFKGYALTASLAAGHVFENDILVGTDVKLVGAAMQGYPASVVTEWGVELCNGSGEVVRSVSYENLSGGTGYTKPGDISSINPVVMNSRNDWPYLPQGAYTVKPYVKTIYGDTKQYGSSSVFNVPALDASKLKPTVSAVTSYSYYLAGDRDNMNKEGTGSSIYKITAGINISDAILSSSKYAVNATVKDKSTTGEPSVTGELNSATQELLAQYDVTEWKAYTIASSVAFDGVTSSETTTTVHVTGLPYKAAPPTNSGNHPWRILTEGSRSYIAFNDDHVLLKTDGTAPSIASSAFYIPADIDFQLYCTYVKNTRSLGSYTYYVYLLNGSTLGSTILSHTSKEKGTYELSGNSTFTNSYNAISCKYGYYALGNDVSVKSIEIKYYTVN